MERKYNPFATDTEAQAVERSLELFGSTAAAAAASDSNEHQATPPSSSGASSRYTTSFPDPFGDEHTPTPGPRVAPTTPIRQQHQHQQQQVGPSNRSNSVTFLDRASGDASAAGSPQRQAHPIQRGGRQASGGLTSFLSRATSVTSSTVTDRVSGAVGSVRSAVDSLSSQFQQASLNERLAGGGGSGEFGTSSQVPGGELAGSQQQPQVPGATICRQRVVLIIDSLGAGQAGAGNGGGGVDWAQQFNQYRRLVRGLPAQSSASLAISSFFTSPFGGGSGGVSSGPTGSTISGQQLDPGDDLIEQVSFSRDVSVLANQSSGTAAVHVTLPQVAPALPSSGFSPALPSQMVSRLASLNLGGGGGGSGTTANNGDSGQQVGAGSLPGGGGDLQQVRGRVIRPEFVVVRQRAKEQHEHLKSIVKALDYCLVPTFEPHDIWAIFQDRQLIFAKLLRVQRKLGKEHFPLIPQIFCQTHKDLTNYIANYQHSLASSSHVSPLVSSQMPLPFLVRTGPLGRGKIRVDNLQMLRDFATIMAASEQMSCTIEQQLDVKCDLVVQRLGTSLKLFKRNYPVPQRQEPRESLSAQTPSEDRWEAGCGGAPTTPRQAASRQTSLSSGVLSSFMTSTSGASQQQQQQQQQAPAFQSPAGRRSSNPAHAAGGPAGRFEKMSDVNARYRAWVEAIAAEFEHKLDAFCIKIAVASNDREYILGLRNCSMDFLGSQENQDEDRRSFVELVMSRMNTILPTTKHQQSPVSREASVAGSGPVRQPSSPQVSQSPYAPAAAASQVRRTSSGDDDSRQQQLLRSSSTRLSGDKRPTFMSQTDVGGSGSSNRSRSVSINQGELSARQQQQMATAAAAGGGRELGRQGTDSHDSLLASDEFSLSASAQQSPATSFYDRQQRAGEGAAGTTGASIGSANTNGGKAGAYQRQFSLGQSLIDQTSTALSSFQRQSMGFLKRLDTRTGSEMSSGGGAPGTPPHSAKSDIGFDRNFESRGAGTSDLSRPGGSMANGGLVGGSLETSAGGLGACSATSSRLIGAGTAKSQSVDVGAGSTFRSAGVPPPKPPPPFAGSLPSRQSSLVANYSGPARAGGAQMRADSTSRMNATGGGGPMTPQNSLAQSSFSADSSCEPFASSSAAAAAAAAAQNSTSLPTSQRQNQRVIRQNSALSAFEPFDASLRGEGPRNVEMDNMRGPAATGGSSSSMTPPVPRRVSSSDGTSGQTATTATGKLDNISMKSGTSIASDETTGTTSTTEDTMNNLKRTFATIFGDRVEG